MRARAFAHISGAAKDALNEEPFTHNAAPHLFSLLQEASGCCFFPAVHWEATFFLQTSNFWYRYKRADFKKKRRSDL
jgi:hypothetical protein